MAKLRRGVKCLLMANHDDDKKPLNCHHQLAENCVFMSNFRLDIHEATANTLSKKNVCEPKLAR